MTDEKKPPQEVAASAQIVLDISQDGLICMTAVCWGKPDSCHAFLSAFQALFAVFQMRFAWLQLENQRLIFGINEWLLTNAKPMVNNAA